MAMETCAQCQTRFAIGLCACPRCQTVSPLFLARSGGPRPVLDPLAPVKLLPFKELRLKAKVLGLSGAGTAEDLAARIAEHEQMVATGGGSQ